MQIDHPDWLFDTLCSMDRPVTFDQFEKRLINRSAQTVEKGSRTVEMNLYMLTSLKLVESHGQKGALLYARTSLGDQLCKVRKSSNNWRAYHRYLRSVLLRNPIVGPTFRRFIALVKKRFNEGNPLSTHELKKLFIGETDRTLLSLSKDAGLVEIVREFVRPREADQGNLEDLKGFNAALRRSYSALIEPRAEGLQPRNIYVEIAKIRDVVLSLFGLTEEKANEKFDHMLTQLLESPMGRDIHLHGAAPQHLPEKTDPEFENRVFRYEGKIYVFISIT